MCIISRIFRSRAILLCLGHTLILAGPLAAATEASAGDAPFINSWLVCGPFKQAVESAATTVPQVGAPMAAMKWEYFDDRLWNRNYDNYQDLAGYYAIKKGVDTRNQWVYAAAFVYSPNEQSAEFRLGSSGSYRLWINGQLVTQSEQPKEVQREMVKPAITLRRGWNPILLEIRHLFTDDTNAHGVPVAKDAAVSYLGFYGRISDSAGREIPGLLTSTLGGQSNDLAFCARPLAASDVAVDARAHGRGLPDNALPVGYLEWPYVWNTSHYGRDNRRIWADPYRFQVGGGHPGYRFEVVAGALPDGLSLRPNGTLDGFCTKIGSYAFTLQVSDADGHTARKEFSIRVNERPNRWFEEGRVGALSHCVAVYPFWVDPGYSADLWAERAKRQGHSLVSIESFQQNYYWPSKFEDPKHPRNQYQPRDAHGKVLDGLKPFAEAVKRHGMKFGIYYPTEGGGLSHHSTDVLLQNCSDLIHRYDPAYLYFDGPQAMGGANYDVIYSHVRNYSADIIINSNVSGGWGGEYGDADLGTSESSHIYGNAGPAQFTKRTVVEPWKSAHTKSNPTPYYAKRDDFRQVAKEMVMNAARGYVDNNDQMPLMSRGPNWDSPADIARRYPMAVQEFSDLREGVANWFAQHGKPERHESTTGTVPYFLAGCGYDDDGKGNVAAFAQGKGPAWGYATARDQSIYLHLIQGPDGKKGWQGEPSLTISPVRHRVQKVILLNDDKPMVFQQEADRLTIQLAGLRSDPIDTIIKIVTDNPARKYKLTHLVATGTQLAPGLLQVNAEGYQTYPALKVAFAKGALHYTSSMPAVATVDAMGRVNAISPGDATISVVGSNDGATASDTLKVVVDAQRRIRVGGEMVGVVLKVRSKEAYIACPGRADLPVTLEGRLKKGGPVSMHTAKVTMKSGVVDFSKGTPYQPVAITEKPLFKFNKLVARTPSVTEALRAALWAEVELDGQRWTTNKVFIDIEPWLALTPAAITASSSLDTHAPELVNDGVAIAPDGSDRSKWSTAGNAPSWITFDLKDPSKVSRVAIQYNTVDQHFVNTPEILEIQASPDGKQWTTLSAVQPPAPGSGAHFGTPTVYRFPATSARYVRLAFPKGNPRGGNVDLLEVVIGNDLSNNLALSARITASSMFNAAYDCRNVADGIVGENARGEWAAKDEPNPWIRLEWERDVRLTKLVLRDRPLIRTHLKQGTLTFSDGSHLNVNDIPDDGSPHVLKFPAKTVRWVQFQASGNQSANNGLSEWEVYELP